MGRTIHDIHNTRSRDSRSAAYKTWGRTREKYYIMSTLSALLAQHAWGRERLDPLARLSGTKHAYGNDDAHQTMHTIDPQPMQYDPRAYEPINSTLKTCKLDDENDHTYHECSGAEVKKESMQSAQNSNVPSKRS